MWIMTTDFSELTPRQTRRVVRFTEPMFLTRSSPRADWRDAKLRGKTLFVVRHFVTLMAGTARACSAVFETCPVQYVSNIQEGGGGGRGGLNLPLLVHYCCWLRPLCAFSIVRNYPMLHNFPLFLPLPAPSSPPLLPPPVHLLSPFLPGFPPPPTYRGTQRIVSVEYLFGKP